MKLTKISEVVTYYSFIFTIKIILSMCISYFLSLFSLMIHIQVTKESHELSKQT